MNSEGFLRLFSCYNLGIIRLDSILQQDIYKTEERNVKGHCTCNIISYKSQNLQIEKQGKKGKAKVNDSNNNNNDNGEENSTKPVYRRKTSKAEKNILEHLLFFSSFPDDDSNLINNILENLNNEGTEWDLPRVKKYWSNYHYR